MTVLLKEVWEKLKDRLPPKWTVLDSFTGEDSKALSDGYLFLRCDGIILGCIVDYRNQRRAVCETGKGPITLEKYTNKWEHVCDADTPEQVVEAFLTYATFGEFDGKPNLSPAV